MFVHVYILIAPFSDQKGASDSPGYPLRHIPLQT